MNVERKAKEQLTILLVDDDTVLLRALARGLQQDFNIMTASTAAGAIELLCTTSFAAAVSDLELPDGSGIDVLQVALDKQPRATRIIYTGAVGQLLAQGVGHVVQHIVSKPAELQVFRSIIAPDTAESASCRELRVRP